MDPDIRYFLQAVAHQVRIKRQLKSLFDSVDTSRVQTVLLETLVPRITQLLPLDASTEQTLVKHIGPHSQGRDFHLTKAKFVSILSSLCGTVAIQEVLDIFGRRTEWMELASGVFDQIDVDQNATMVVEELAIMANSVAREVITGFDAHNLDSPLLTLLPSLEQLCSGRLDFLIHKDQWQDLMSALFAASAQSVDVHHPIRFFERGPLPLDIAEMAVANMLFSCMLAHLEWRRAHRAIRDICDVTRNSTCTLEQFVQCIR